MDDCALALAADPPMLVVSWKELDRAPSPDVSGWSFWCSTCLQCPVFVRTPFRSPAKGAVDAVSCWTRCYECRTSYWLTDREIDGARVLSPDECEAYRVMEV